LAVATIYRVSGAGESGARQDRKPPFGSGASQTSRRHGLLQGVQRIVTLGDSITEAGGQEGGYVWHIRQQLAAAYGEPKIEVLNAGISGHKATDMQARFDRDVLQKKPGLVTINVGVNDVWHAFHDWNTNTDHPKGDLPAGVPLPLYRAKVEEMVRAAKAAGIKVVLVSPGVIYEKLDSPENRRLTEYVAAMKDIARKSGSVFVDLRKPFRSILETYGKPGKLLLTTDGVHLNAEGNRLMAYTILRALGVPARRLRELVRGVPGSV
jgi:lysophospholipase L1-like esterase